MLIYLAFIALTRKISRLSYNVDDEHVTKELFLAMDVSKLSSCCSKIQMSMFKVVSNILVGVFLCNAFCCMKYRCSTMENLLKL